MRRVNWLAIVDNDPRFRTIPGRVTNNADLTTALSSILATETVAHWVEKLSAAIRTALQKPTVVDQLARLGSDARGNTPEEFTTFLLDETRKWTEVMKQANIKVMKQANIKVSE